MARTEIPLSQNLTQLPPAVRSTVQAVRRLVKAVEPKAEEITYQSQPPRSKSAMWKLTRYVLDGANVAGIGTVADHVDLFFYRGTELDDKDRLLKGGGKSMRFISLAAPADAERADVKRLVRQAFKLGG
jgi:hypothetical protein